MFDCMQNVRQISKQMTGQLAIERDRQGSCSGEIFNFSYQRSLLCYSIRISPLFFPTTNFCIFANCTSKFNLPIVFLKSCKIANHFSYPQIRHGINVNGGEYEIQVSSLLTVKVVLIYSRSPHCHDTVIIARSVTSPLFTSQ